MFSKGIIAEWSTLTEDDFSYPLEDALEVVSRLVTKVETRIAFVHGVYGCVRMSVAPFSSASKGH